MPKEPTNKHNHYRPKMYDTIQFDKDGDIIMRSINPEVIVIDDDIETKEKMQSTTIIIDDKKPYKKQYISLVLKKLVWNKYIGKEIGQAKCYCCKLTDIHQISFHCGHVIAEKNGGNLTVENLRPICQSCNSSMRTQNMEEFMKKYNL